MNTHNHAHLLATWFAGALMLLTTTNILAVTPACSTTLPANTTTTLDSNMDCLGRAINFGGGSDNAVLDCDGFIISCTPSALVGQNSLIV